MGHLLAIDTRTTGSLYDPEGRRDQRDDQATLLFFLLRAMLGLSGCAAYIGKVCNGPKLSL